MENVQNRLRNIKYAWIDAPEDDIEHENLTAYHDIKFLWELLHPEGFYPRVEEDDACDCVICKP